MTTLHMFIYQTVCTVSMDLFIDVPVITVNMFKTCILPFQTNNYFVLNFSNKTKRARNNPAQFTLPGVEKLRC